LLCSSFSGCSCCPQLSAVDISPIYIYSLPQPLCYSHEQLFCQLSPTAAHTQHPPWRGTQYSQNSSSIDSIPNSTSAKAHGREQMTAPQDNANAKTRVEQNNDCDKGTHPSFQHNTSAIKDDIKARRCTIDHASLGIELTRAARQHNHQSSM